MEKIRFDRIVSVTSEINGHPAKNIIQGEIDPKKSWLCEKGSNKAAVILQLERAAILTSVHVGNAHSALVEILVGKAAADTADRFESLVPVSVLMTPQDSASGNNKNCTRLFNKTDFSSPACGKCWDRIKVVCSQPFNKHVSFGLCFVEVQGEKEKVELPVPAVKSEFDEKSEDEIQIGSFFKKKRNSGGTTVPLAASGSTSGAEMESSSVERTSGDGDGGERKMVKTDPEKKPENVPKEKLSESKGGEKEKKQERRESESPNVTTKRKIHGGEKDRRRENDRNEKKKAKKVRRKPFEKLLEDVVFVISGFQNPLRGNLRSLAFEMGAKYSPDWGSHCTHLICACANTPKFNQVKGKGKIVRKEWLEKCHADRKRYPWRRFALAKKDSTKPESEEEIEEETESREEISSEPETSNTANERQRDAGAGTGKPEPIGVVEYDIPTDEDEEGKGIVNTKDYPMPYLPNFLSGKTFYIDPNLKNKSVFERYITAYSGILKDDFDETVEFYMTDEGGTSLDAIMEKFSKVVAVKPSWIWEMNSKQKYTPETSHLVKQ